MLHPPLSAFSFLFIFESFSEQKFGIKRVDKGQMTNKDFKADILSIGRLAL